MTQLHWPNWLQWLNYSDQSATMTQLLWPIGYNDPIPMTNQLLWPNCSDQSATMTQLLWPISCHDPNAVTNRLQWLNYSDQSTTMTKLFRPINCHDPIALTKSATMFPATPLRVRPKVGLHICSSNHSNAVNSRLPNIFANLHKYV